MLLLISTRSSPDKLTKNRNENCVYPQDANCTQDTVLSCDAIIINVAYITVPLDVARMESIPLNPKTPVDGIFTSLYQVLAELIYEFTETFSPFKLSTPLTEWIISVKKLSNIVIWVMARRRVKSILTYLKIKRFPSQLLVHRRMV